MKNLFYFLIILVTLTSCDKQKNVKKITTVQISHLVQNMGSISLNEVVWKEFKILNTGKYDLLISAIDIGCTCMSSKLDTKKPVKPGKFVNFSLAYNAKLTGKFQKIVILDMNIEEGYKTLIIRGNVLLPKK